MKPKNIENELIEAGASLPEAKDLARLAGQLRKVPLPPPRFVIRNGISRGRLALATGLAAVICLFAGGGVVALAQTSQPGTALYPVKRASEDITMKVSPGFADRVMMRRVAEIDELVSANGSQDTVMDEVQDYESVFAKAKPDQAMRDYCADHLRHAENLASGSEKQAIASALSLITYRD